MPPAKFGDFPVTRDVGLPLVTIDAVAAVGVLCRYSRPEGTYELAASAALDAVAVTSVAAALHRVRPATVDDIMLTWLEATHDVVLVAGPYGENRLDVEYGGAVTISTVGAATVATEDGGADLRRVLDGLLAPGS